MGGKESEELKRLICKLYLCPPFRRQYRTRLRDTSRCCQGVPVMSVPELKCTQYLIGSGIYLLGRNCTGMCLCLATNDCPNTDSKQKNQNKNSTQYLSFFFTTGNFSASNMFHYNGSLGTSLFH